ncbi:dTDP-4-dehydrorhamnose reductase [Oxalobacteraceae bacterium OM1]|nr:dTDP-4-dehydrorhamnose reductase [Oxalobacteraceae bacterium OM1]
MKILLTGRNGQVGYELERSLQCLGDVVAFDRAGLDLADADAVRRTVREVQPTLIVNAAAYTAVDQAEREPELAMRVNGIAPGILAEEADALGAALVHYSTDYVFDGTQAQPYREDSVPNPQNAYGRSKLAGEQAIAAASIPHLIFRTSWVYGLRGKNFLLTMQRLARERNELRVVDDQVGAPTWCRTIADATVHAVAMLRKRGSETELDFDLWREQGGLYHLAAKGQTSWYGFAQTIVAHRSLEAKPTVMPAVTPIRTQDYPLPARRPANSVLDCSRFTQTFCNLPDWKQALHLCLD